MISGSGCWNKRFISVPAITHNKRAYKHKLEAALRATNVRITQLAATVTRTKLTRIGDGDLLSWK
ncbi:MAG: hypothetical protein JNM27_11165 [Leptospirales bacterium]|nr:hypothetical protein [Leptospirales bacterium]